jgi:diaminopimelate epimerase
VVDEVTGVQFEKMEGLGNDFVVLEGPRSVTAAEVAAWCDRRRGIGADGVLVVSPLGDGRVRMEYWNADGSPAEMCGNGLRCVARFAYERGWVNVASFVVETAVGERAVEIVSDEVVRVELGPVTTGGQEEAAGVRVGTASVGNPHAVLFVDDPSAADVAGLGSLIETDPAFPAGTNVEFVSVRSADAIDMRVWERGVGETLACGTGAAAAVAVGIEAGLLDSRATVRLPGGSLQVEVGEGTAWITGPARRVFRGTWDGDA